MKSCPTCNRTFEDTFTFCLVDGSILSAPFDPTAATQGNPLPRRTTDVPTEVLPYSAPTVLDQTSPTLAAAKALTWGARPVEPTLPSTPESATYLRKVPVEESNNSAAAATTLKFKAFQWIAGIALMFIVGMILAGADEAKWAQVWLTQGIVAGIIGGGIAVLIRRKLIGILAAPMLGIAVGLVLYNNFRGLNAPGVEPKVKTGAFFFMLGSWALTRFVGWVMNRRGAVSPT